MPLWALGPLALICIPFVPSESRGLLLGVGLICTPIFTIPKAIRFWREQQGHICGVCGDAFEPGDVVYESGTGLAIHDLCLVHEPPGWRRVVR